MLIINKDYIVLSQRLAGYLMLSGFTLLKIKPSKKNGISRNIFIFKESEELIDCIHSYKSN